ncbi:CBS domain-containing protein [Bacillota bacterium LX-D]|nr:CBS domain-containing protein [Bacillota bacterium LX-D]
MNIAFFLLPKKDVVYLTSKSTIRQALEKMEHHRYTAVPIIDQCGKYVGTLTEGDLLWKIKNTPDLTFSNAHKHTLAEVPRRVTNKAVFIDAEMLDLLELAEMQNFVPVVDDCGIFIGIVRRREIIEYCSQLLNLKQGRQLSISNG